MYGVSPHRGRDAPGPAGETPALRRTKSMRRGRRRGSRRQITLRQRFSRHHLRTVCGFPDEGGHDDGGLHQVVALQAIVDVVVGVVRALPVLDLILDELKTGKADAIEGEVIGAAGVSLGDGGDAEVLQRLDPGGEDRGDGEVVLRVDAADLAGTVIET